MEIVARMELVAFLAVAPITAGGDGVGSVATMVFYITAAIALSFLCSILEAVLLSSSVSHVEGLVQQGRRAGRIMQRLRANVERPISAILTLNTIAHTAGATLAGAEAVLVFGDAYVGIISAVLTLLILVLSEIIPKTLGAVYWKQLTVFAAYTIQGMVILLLPAVLAFELLGRLMRPQTEMPTVTRGDLEVMARIGEQEGALHERENRILSNLLHLNKVMVNDIMTPRTVVLALKDTLTVGEVIRSRLPYSRIPIYSETVDNVTGYVLRHDIVHAVATDQHDTRISALRRPINAIPETLTVAQVLDKFIRDREHIFLILDEYGGMSGIITMEDAVESLLGIEITDESDLVADLRQLAQQRYERKFAEMQLSSIPRPPADSLSDE
jgi:CBS domain containing-hemolysin-like protein